MKRTVQLAALALITQATSVHAHDALDGAGNTSTLSVEAPAAHYPPSMVRLKLIGIGLLLTGGAWAASFASAQAWPEVAQPKDGTSVPSGPPGSNDMRIPIVGPWIALGKSGCSVSHPNCGADEIAARAALYMLDGIAQIAGLALITEAIVMKTEAPANKKTLAAKLGLRWHGVEFAPVPVTEQGMTGLGVAGRF